MVSEWGKDNPCVGAEGPVEPSPVRREGPITSSCSSTIGMVEENAQKKDEVRDEDVERQRCREMEM